MSEDAELTVARSSAARLKRVQQPTGSVHRGGGTTGDGDECPNPPPGVKHGQMMVLDGKKRQYCPNQMHDGRPGENRVEPTRAFWPFNNAELKQAISAWQEAHRG